LLKMNVLDVYSVWAVWLRSDIGTVFSLV